MTDLHQKEHKTLDRLFIGDNICCCKCQVVRNRFSRVIDHQLNSFTAKNKQHQPITFDWRLACVLDVPFRGVA